MPDCQNAISRNLPASAAMLIRWDRSKIMAVLNWIVYTYFGFFVYYLFFFAVASRFPRKREKRSLTISCIKHQIPSTKFQTPNSKNQVSSIQHPVSSISKVLHKKLHRFAVLFPVYKEDRIIMESVRTFFAQEYPKDAYDVFVLADSLHDATLRELRFLGAEVIIISGENRTKAKALNLAMNTLDSERYDLCVVFDADNIVEPGFLSSVNEEFNNGIMALQCHRVAKNLDTPIAYLDALSEEIANSMLRKGHRTLGFSSGLIGSGMAFEFLLFKYVMSSIHATNGFDKDLEFALFKNRIEIEYADHILVYDEKVQSADVLQHQRTRWFAAQWKNIRKGFRSLRENYTTDGFNKWLQMIMLPRVFLFMAVNMLTIAAFLFADGTTALRWLHLAVLLTAAFFIAIPNSLYRKELVDAIISFPKAVKALFGALLNIRAANKGFLHTPHSASSVTVIGGN
jgi:cellulose synthase/poly-beta-1,6-N-acetylglucosamine synthase-like glycosyltransferase